MIKLWDAFLFWKELDMLTCRLEAMDGWRVQHVLCETPRTFRGERKQLYGRAVLPSLGSYNRKISLVTMPDVGPTATPWQLEHAQRDAAWEVIDAGAEPDDIVLICDVDEIPNETLLRWDGPDVAAVGMRTMIHAVDWEIPYHLLPPTCVIARAWWLRMERMAGRTLSQVRDNRRQYRVLPYGGFHLSWLGGPEAAAEKMRTGTCHTELEATGEAMLIRSGDRYRTGAGGGGWPVVPVDVDQDWPAYVWKRRCPADWFRPR